MMNYATKQTGGESAMPAVGQRIQSKRAERIRTMGKQVYGYSMSEHEYRVWVPEMHVSGDASIAIGISAHGGGTVGESYAGNGWDYLVTVDGTAVLEGSDIRSAEGRPAGHAEMARSLCSFLSAAGESLSMSGDRSEYAGQYSGPEIEFLTAEYERLGSFSSDV